MQNQIEDWIGLKGKKVWHPSKFCIKVHLCLCFNQCCNGNMTYLWMFSSNVDCHVVTFNIMREGWIGKIIKMWRCWLVYRDKKIGVDINLLCFIFILCVTTCTYIFFQAPFNIGTYVHPQSLMHLNASWKCQVALVI